MIYIPIWLYFNHIDIANELTILEFTFQYGYISTVRKRGQAWFTSKFTFQYGYISTNYESRVRASFLIFTFQYGYISTTTATQGAIFKKIIYIPIWLYFNPGIFHDTYSVSISFTFQYGYISTVRNNGKQKKPKYLHSNMVIFQQQERAEESK